MIHDVIIVGAGPCGLAVAARLCESTPSALFTDAEHTRYWQRFTRTRTYEQENRRNQKNVPELEANSGVRNGHANSLPISILTLDASSNKWLASWKARFEKLKITHLRSPLFFHCDPRDRDGLLEFAHVGKRTGELEEIPNVVGQEVSKSQKKKRKRTNRHSNATSRHLHLDNRDQIDYYTPSASLFEAYCQNLSNRYEVDKIIEQATVSTITYEDTGIATESNPLFSVVTDSGQTFLARAVVLAIGPGNKPAIPPEYRPLLSVRGAERSLSHVLAPAAAIGTALNTDLLPSQTRHTANDQTVHVAIVGGGLSSAQLVQILLDHTDSSSERTTAKAKLKVHLILRSDIKIKPFDVDLPWVSKLRNRNMAEFWSADTDGERFEMLKHARNGGSMPSKWVKLLRKYEKEGTLEIHRQKKILVPSITVGCARGQHDGEGVLESLWDVEKRQWQGLELGSTRATVVLKTSQSSSLVESADEAEKHLSEQGSSNSESMSSLTVAEARTILPPISHIFFATGTPLDIESISCLSDLRTTHPIPSIHGLPQLNENLMWTDDIPLFVTGALAGLRLGPGAGNLAGARLGAERIAWALEDVLRPDGSTAHPTNYMNRSKNNPKQVPRTGGFTGRKEDAIKISGQSIRRKDSAYSSGSDDDNANNTQNNNTGNVTPPQDQPDHDPFFSSSSSSTSTTQEKRRKARIDRSEFTGGFSNQFQVLAL